MPAMAVLSTRSGQMASWAADCRFHIVPRKQFINGQVEPFQQELAKRVPASRSGRFIKASFFESFLKLLTKLLLNFLIKLLVFLLLVHLLRKLLIKLLT